MPTLPTAVPAAHSKAPAPVITRTRATWVGDQRFEAGPGARTQVIDAGAVAAPGPVETLLNALATCSAVDILTILAKRRTPVERLSVQVEGERRPTAPRRLVRVSLEFRIDGAGIEREHAERAIHLSYEQYCSVASSLAADIESEARLTLNGVSHPPFPLAVAATSR